MRRALVLCVVAGLLAAACSGGGGGDEAESSTAKVDEVVPAEGDVLAEVEGVGAILEGFAVFAADDPDVTASEAGRAPEVEGVLEAGPGLAGEVGAPFTGALQVRLDVPEPPTDDAIPVVLHRGADGRVSVEPALWDPGASQMVVWAGSFSDRWGAWFDPRNWIEEVVQVGQGAFDFVADFVTGRTDPPGCRNNPPGWASMSTNEASSLHVCAQSNPADGGAERFELFLRSNRRTAQLVTIPSVTKDYVWTENVPDDWRRLLTSFTGVDANTNMAVLGSYAMSVGFRQPGQSVDFEMLAYQTPRVIIANPVLALLGNLPVEGTLGVMAAVAKCHAEASGIDITRFDAIPDSNPPDIGFLEGMVRCAFETLQHPELAFGVVQEVAGAIGISNAAALDKINGALRSLAPTVARIAAGLAIGSTLANLWDGIFDNLADGRITIALTGSATSNVYRELLRRVDAGANIGTTDFEAFAFDESQPRERHGGVSFRSPSGNIVCTSFDLEGVVCHIAEHTFQDRSPQDCGPMSWIPEYISLYEDVEQGVCTGGIGHAPNSEVLPYGSTLRFSHFACLSAEDGVTCVDTSAPLGFRLSRSTFVAAGLSSPQPAGSVECDLVPNPYEDPARPRIAAGEVTCDEAEAILDRYFNDPPTPPEGSGAYVSFDGWTCGLVKSNDRELAFCEHDNGAMIRAERV